MLHRYWPNDCCLCSHEAKIKDLEAQLASCEKEHKEELEKAKIDGKLQALEDVKGLMRRAYPREQIHPIELQALKESYEAEALKSGEEVK